MYYRGPSLQLEGRTFIYSGQLLSKRKTPFLISKLLFIESVGIPSFKSGLQGHIFHPDFISQSMDILQQLLSISLGAMVGRRDKIIDVHMMFVVKIDPFPNTRERHDLIVLI
jgi:hypothetical protein